MKIGSLGQEDPPEEKNGNTLQYSCLENLMERGACPPSTKKNVSSKKHCISFKQRIKLFVHMGDFQNSI